MGKAKLLILPVTWAHKNQEVSLNVILQGYF